MPLNEMTVRPPEPRSRAHNALRLLSRIAAGDTVCLIEVMKLFNSIPAGIDGTVVAIHAENAALVEHNQPLIYAMPAGRT